MCNERGIFLVGYLKTKITKFLQYLEMDIYFFLDKNLNKRKIS